MGITYTQVNWKFDAAKWGMDLSKIRQEDIKAAMELSGLTRSGWNYWLKGQTTGSYIHPGMLNFLNVCNLLDLDPRDYFTIGS